MAHCRRCARSFGIGGLLCGVYIVLTRRLFGLDVMAQTSRVSMPTGHAVMRLINGPISIRRVGRPVSGRGRGQGLRVTGFGPLALVGPKLAEPLQCVRVCPYGPAA